MIRLFTMIALLCLFVSVAQAEDKKVIKASAEVELSKMTKALNKACGSAIDIKVEWNGFKDEHLQKYSMPAFCGTPVKSLTELCIGKNTKTYVKNNIKSIACHFGGEGKRAMKVKDGRITYTVDFNAANAREFGHEALLENL